MIMSILCYIFWWNKCVRAEWFIRYGAHFNICNDKWYRLCACALIIRTIKSNDAQHFILYIGDVLAQTVAPKWLFDSPTFRFHHIFRYMFIFTHNCISDGYKLNWKSIIIFNMPKTTQRTKFVVINKLRRKWQIPF